MTAAVPFLEFAENVLGLTLTPAWRVLIKVAIDGCDPRDLEGDELELAETILGPVETIPTSARRLLVWILGRESWKTTIAAALALYTLLTADITSAGPGDVPVFMCIAPDKRTAGLSVRIALDLAKSVPAIAKCVVAETADGFTLRRPTDGRMVSFECFAVSRAGANLRGRSILGAILDESMFFTSDAEGDYVKNDRDVYRAIVPRLMKGGRIIFISTPWPVETLTGELFTLNHEHPITAIAARASTLTMRDNDPELAERIALERATDPVDTARERDADMTAMAGAGSMFDAGALDRSIFGNGTETEVPPDLCRTMAIGVAWDLALRRDAAASAVVGRIGTEYFLLATDEIRPQGEPLKLSKIVDTFAERMKSYGARRAYADQHCFDPAREFVRAHKLGLEEAPHGATGKQEIHIHARAIIHAERFHMPRVPGALAQLKAIRAKAAPGGGLSIWSPRRKGSHGDLASAIVLAIYAASHAHERRADGAKPISFVAGARDTMSLETWSGADRRQTLGNKTVQQLIAVHGHDPRGRGEW